jgi:hypothetical protein|tara:strand:- start:182 stop:349 length:168 start_codon:yes stop_codon:yes gene_type:complete
MKYSELVYSSDVEEFFWKDTDEAVESEIPIGYDLERGDEVELVLFDDIYWKPDYE